MSFSNLTDMKYPGAAACPQVLTDNRVYVIDDDKEIRKSLHFLLSTIDIVSWPFGSATDFLGDLNFLKASPILLDIRMPDMDGIQLMNVLLDQGIRWPIIVMTAHGEIKIAVQAIKLGAIEFLEKPFAFEALDDSLRSAFVQLVAMKGSEAIRENARRRFEPLSPRETNVIKLLMQGLANKVVAHALSLSVRTIEMHRANALSKLQVKSLAEVAHLADVAGLEFF